MVEKFEVNKIYVLIGDAYEYECVFVDVEGFAILKTLQTGRHFKERNPMWYIEKKNEGWINIYESEAVFHKTRESADKASGSGRMACIKVTWTDGEGLKGDSS